MIREEAKKSRPDYRIFPGLKTNTCDMTIDRIEEIVCSSPFIQIPTEYLQKKCRKREISQARSICMMLAKRFLPKAKIRGGYWKGDGGKQNKEFYSQHYFSYSFLQRRYGMKSHASIIMNIRHYEGFYQTDPNFRKVVDEIAYKIRRESEEISKELV